MTSKRIAALKSNPPIPRVPESSVAWDVKACRACGRGSLSAEKKGSGGGDRTLHEAGRDAIMEGSPHRVHSD